MGQERDTLDEGEGLTEYIELATLEGEGCIDCVDEPPPGYVIRPPRPRTGRGAALIAFAIVVASIIIFAALQAGPAATAAPDGPTNRTDAQAGIQDGSYLEYRIAYTDFYKLRTGTCRITFSEVTNVSMKATFEIQELGERRTFVRTVNMTGGYWPIGSAFFGDSVPPAPEVVGPEDLPTSLGVVKTTHLNYYTSTYRSEEWAWDGGFPVRIQLMYLNGLQTVMDLVGTNIGGVVPDP